MTHLDLTPAEASTWKFVDGGAAPRYVGWRTYAQGRAPHTLSLPWSSRHPLDALHFVTVYHYRYWDEDRQKLLTAHGEATLECIRSGLGIPIIASAHHVLPHLLDSVGRLISAWHLDHGRH